ncbi:hypothetical protein WR25_18686 [Diploscapter pachys]|uniref:Uncharacterized protein n=1 Tax=Diploscapter pachys TaxID=2018661 RepID=A0A2A2JA92_9BILA|nr:hypothetical protein WR25_18686 [Diploscapter pachys]
MSSSLNSLLLTSLPLCNSRHHSPRSSTSQQSSELYAILDISQPSTGWIFGDGTVNGSPKRFFPSYLKNSVKQKLQSSAYKKLKHQ